MIPARCMCEGWRLTWTGTGLKPCFRCGPSHNCILLSESELLG